MGLALYTNVSKVRCSNTGRNTWYRDWRFSCSFPARQVKCYHDTSFGQRWPQFMIQQLAYQKYKGKGRFVPVHAVKALGEKRCSSSNS